METEGKPLDLIGMEVRGSEGAKIGKVVECQDDGFTVDKGLFFPTSYLFPYSAIASSGGGELYLRQPSRYYLDGGARDEAGSHTSGRTGPDTAPEGTTLGEAEPHEPEAEHPIDRLGEPNV